MQFLFDRALYTSTILPDTNLFLRIGIKDLSPAQRVVKPAIKFITILACVTIPK